MVETNVAYRADSYGQGAFLNNLSVQLKVIKALILRELSGRFGRENIGYLWMIGEPLMLASVITLIHLAEPGRYGGDIQPAPFAILGYTIYIIFRGVFSRADGIVALNIPLFYHRQVKILDIMIARTIVETTGCFIAGTVLMTIAIIFDLAALPARPLYLLGAIALMMWWSFATGMLAARASFHSETVGRQLHVIAYFCIPISGSFFALSVAPPWIRDWLQWFPMTLIMEQARYGQFRSASFQYVSPVYVSAVCACLTYAGLLMLRKVQREM